MPSDVGSFAHVSCLSSSGRITHSLRNFQFPKANHRLTEALLDLREEA